MSNMKNDSDTVDENKRQRVSFAFMPDGEIIVQDEGDVRPMIEVLGMKDNKAEFEKVVRGVFDSHNIVFFIGEYYMPVPRLTQYSHMISDLMYFMRKRVGSSYHDVAIWNGVSVGKIGEVWPPISLDGKLTPFASVVWFSN